MLKYGSVNYIFGSPGAGKTTVLSKIARFYIKKNIKVYSNFPCKGCILIDDESIGYYNFSSSVILIDEAGVCLSNRDAFNKNALMNDKKDYNIGNSFGIIKRLFGWQASLGVMSIKNAEICQIIISI